MRTQTPHHNDLTPGEAERLALLLEEMSEASQEICKILRHGFESYDPFDPVRATNRVRLTRELGHVQAALSLMERSRDLDFEAMKDAWEQKLVTVKPWLHHQED